MIYRFDHPHEGSLADITARVGGKGASLWAMSSQMQLPTPPGFTIGCDYSARFDQEGLSDSLLATIVEEIGRLEAQLGRRFGDPNAPLLLAVRSGAAVSMPGMMETVLNVGLTPDTLEGLATLTGSRCFALDSYQRFLSMYHACVLGEVPPDTHARPDDERALQNSVTVLEAAVGERIGAEALRDPMHLLRETIAAVFRSRHSAPAKAYRQREGLPEELGTSVTVQSMVFGNLDELSGTGVVFSRDPSTGENVLTGDWMRRAQGEDVVAGIRATRPITELAEEMPAVYRELQEHALRLEAWYRDMVDIEFTVEHDRLWILQARTGKRSAAAAARIAVELSESGEFGVDRREAVRRVPEEVLNGARSTRQSRSEAEPLLVALPASPGAATGKIVLTPDAAIDAAEAGEDVILVRRETSPADIHGMSAACGILTTLGGLMSHAAVVARDWGLPAVVGATQIRIEAGGLYIDDLFIAEGELISIDGASGAVYRGATQTESQVDPYLERIRDWSRSLDTLNNAN